jgi:hypothetical protein
LPCPGSEGDARNVATGGCEVVGELGELQGLSSKSGVSDAIVDEFSSAHGIVRHELVLDEVLEFPVLRHLYHFLSSVAPKTTIR